MALSFYSSLAQGNFVAAGEDGSDASAGSALRSATQDSPGSTREQLAVAPNGAGHCPATPNGADHRSAAPNGEGPCAALSNGVVADGSRDEEKPQQVPAQEAPVPPPKGGGSSGTGAFGSFYAAVAPKKTGGQTVYGFAPQVAAAADKAAAAEASRAEGIDGCGGPTEPPAQHRHKSTWHAALNRRIISQTSADHILGMAEELLNGGFDLQNCVTSISCVSQARDGLRFKADPRFLELLFRLEVLWDPVSFCVPLSEREEVAPHHYASVAAALARMQPSRKDGTMQRILRTVAANAAAMAPAAQPMDLTLLAWAFATLLHAPKQLMPAVAREATAKVSEFTEMHISITMWAFAKLDVRYDPWITAMTEETLTRLSKLTPQHISNIAWALGTLMIKSDCKIGADCHRLMHALAVEAAGRIEDFDPQALSNVAWALSHLGMYHDQYMRRLAEVVPPKLSGFPTLDITNMIWAYAKMGLHVPEFVSLLREEVRRRLREFSGGELARVVWSLRLLGALDASWLSAASARFAECCIARPPAPTPEGWAALHMVNCAAPFRKRIGAWKDVELYFRNLVYAPLLQALRGIQQARVDADVEAASDQAQGLVRKLDVDFFGPHYTRSLLWHLGFADPTDALAGDAFAACWCLPGAPEDPPRETLIQWGPHARVVANDALRELKEQMSEGCREFDRFGPHERRVIAWCAYELQVEVPAAQDPERRVTLLREEGRIARFIEDEQRALCLRGERTVERLLAGGAGEATRRAVESGFLGLEDVKRAQRWLPGLIAQHARLAHCERQALLEVLLLIVGTAASSRAEPSPTALVSGTFDGTEGVAVGGEIRLYVAHFCCISCLAVMCHFSRRAPGVRLCVDYDDCWMTRALDT